MSALPWEEICLAAIGDNQGAVKQVDYALKQVMKNIADLNTDPRKERVVTLKIKIKPIESDPRKKADITYNTEVKLAGDMPGTDSVFISQDGVGSVPMFEQLELGARLDEVNGGAE